MQQLLSTTEQIHVGIIKLAGRKEDDLAAWEKWKVNQSDYNLEKIFKNMAGLINSNVNKWSQRRIPRVALKTEAEKLTLQALKTYDPTRGASLATHVNTRLQKLYGFAARHGDFAKIPEERFAGIRKFNQAEERLRNKLKREPNASDIADYLKISIPEVRRYRDENIKVLIEGGGSDFSSVEAIWSNKRYALEAVYFGDLNPEEKTVYEYLNGRGRKKVTSTGEIAILINISASKVARLKKSIAKKIEKYL